MTTSAFDEAFEKVKNLAANFQAHKDRYLSTAYQEAEVRLDFIDPLLEALGWKRSQNPYQQELKVEHHAHGGTQRRADYAFFIAPRCSDGDARFFLEAKKPHGDIATAANYFQTIFYGYSSGTPLAVLTDFEQFHILDCRYEPNLKTALDHCVDKFDYPDYLDRDKFGKIYWLFSREAFTSGSFDAYVKQLRGRKRARAPKPVDESLLERLDELRNTLAHAFKKNNPRLDSEALTEFAQRTLDRLVFLRFLEDKGIERQGAVNKFAGSATAWRDFIASCRQLDSIYNGIIYRQQPTLDAPTFRMDNAAFAEVCKRLAHGDSDYNFNFDFIPIHILGSIYERFLGKVIVATDKRVRVEEKPEVRKAGGVYYTPEYIVRYIVENTIGKLIAGKTPAEIAEMRFADIACGSGSFLLAVYDLLLTYHGTWYNANRNKARKGDCIEHGGKLYLTLAKKRDILVKNIYGVDVDAQAVEVCQLSLCLKLLKDESPETTAQYLLDFEHTAQMKKLLPDLSKNIVCGNSLIGTDILDGQLFAGEEERKLNAMDFEEAFPEVMKRGRFDAIVGNPPWVTIEKSIMGEASWNYLRNKYKSVDVFKVNTFPMFVERALSLISIRGQACFILPNRLLDTPSYKLLRKVLCEKLAIESIVDIPQGSFENVIAGNIILKLNQEPKQGFAIIRNLFADGNLSGVATTERRMFSSMKPDGYVINLNITPANEKLLEKIERGSVPLGNLFSIHVGMMIKGKFDLFQRTRRAGNVPMVMGRDFHRYTGLHLNYIDLDSAVIFGGTKNAAKHTARPKLFVRKTGNQLIASIDEKGVYAEQSVYLLIPNAAPSPKFYCALVNSRLLTYFFLNKLITNPQAYPYIQHYDLVALPVRDLDIKNPADKSRHDAVLAKVEAMLAAKKELTEAKTDKDKAYYERRCSDLDRQIDALVYELYGLTADEIKIVEENK